MQAEPERFRVEITPRALEFIHSRFILKNAGEPRVLVITNGGYTGGAYLFMGLTMQRIQTLNFYRELNLESPITFTFPIYAEPMLLNEHLLPQSFVLDLYQPNHGDPHIFVKNPEFE
jgi:hypothetical protein